MVLFLQKSPINYSRIFFGLSNFLFLFYAEWNPVNRPTAPPPARQMACHRRAKSSDLVCHILHAGAAQRLDGEEVIVGQPEPNLSCLSRCAD
jgi:hypothetical protein